VNYGRDDALTERIGERIVDGRGQDSMARSNVEIDRDIEQRARVLLVAGDVGMPSGLISASGSSTKMTLMSPTSAFPRQ
jgi:hypothetical protein